jgi:hypothetical protein
MGLRRDLEQGVPQLVSAVPRLRAGGVGAQSVHQALKCRRRIAVIAGLENGVGRSLPYDGRL